jgi:F420-dependent oxidoreductase-like protein
MKVGIQVPNFTWPGGPERIGNRLAEIARAADQGGFASLWVMDHLFQIRGVGPVENEMLECYATLSYLAGLTKVVKLGAMVTAAVYRHPGVLIKSVTTLDVLSGGRAYLGIGAAWNEQEARGLGIPFPPLKERFERLEEILQIARLMWSDEQEPFQGKYYQLERSLNHPQPLSKPHPPVLIGGMGERKTLRLVAQYADACNLFARAGVETLKAKLEILKKHCEKVGRDCNEIEKTSLVSVHLAPGKTSVSEVIEQCRSLADIGIQHVIFNMPNDFEIKPLEIIGREIIPVVANF